VRKRLFLGLLIGALVVVAPSTTSAQTYSTGPAGLARQMPQIYSPYMANQARIKYQQKKKLKKKRTNTRTTKRSRS
jgi:hypothetical protein